MNLFTFIYPNNFILVFFWTFITIVLLCLLNVTIKLGLKSKKVAIKKTNVLLVVCLFVSPVISLPIQQQNLYNVMQYLIFL